MNLLTVTIQRATESAAGDGTFEKTFATVSSPQLHTRQLTGLEIEQNAKLGYKVSDRWYDFSGTLDIQVEDRIIYSGKTYSVTRINNPHLMSNHKEIDTVVVDSGKS